jgi:hypothetical protein
MNRSGICAIAATTIALGFVAAPAEAAENCTLKSTTCRRQNHAEEGRQQQSQRAYQSELRRR